MLNSLSQHLTFDAPFLAAAASEWPGWQSIWEVLSLQAYNTRLVILSTTLLGLACGLIGSFLLLRKRSLMGDALSHATLPGIAIAFIVMVKMGGAGKELGGLLLGATISGILGFLLVLLVRNLTRIKDDTAMGIVLSVFFGAGIALLSMIQQMPEGSAAGLEYFIYGKAASMTRPDFFLLATVTGAAILMSLLIFKEMRLLCFDEKFAASLGWPVHVLDVVMLLLVTAVTVAGLQAVGLILIIAFLITPAAAARFWTDRFDHMLMVAGLIGAASGWLGASLSAVLPRLPAGAIIVLAAALLFLLSMLLGTARGVIPRLLDQSRLRRKINRQHLLRAVYEVLEEHQRRDDILHVQNEPASLAELLPKRSWTRSQLLERIREARQEDLVTTDNAITDGVQLTLAGFQKASQVTRNHRLWEMYLIKYADIAPTHVDRDADAVEHVLGDDMVQELEQAIADERKLPTLPGFLTMPQSPHPLK